MNATIPASPAIIADITESFNTNYVGFASFTVLIWDHIDTFADEVEYIWFRDKGPICYLFLINRYLTPLGFILNLFAYLSPLMNPERYVLFTQVPSLTVLRCNHFVRYEGSTVFIAVHIASLMMFIRIRALYYPSKWPLVILGVLFTTSVSMGAWLLSSAQRVDHVPGSGVHSCSMIFSPNLSRIASSSAWLPLLYDSTVFALTLYKTLDNFRRTPNSKIIKRIFTDGILYYSVIFAVNLVLTLMIVFAPPGLKNITAQTEQLITVTMMSRITINLKKSAHKVVMTADKVHQSIALPRLRPSASRNRKWGTSLAFADYDELNSVHRETVASTSSRLHHMNASRDQTETIEIQLSTISESAHL